jgi:hypothetical protein
MAIAFDAATDGGNNGGATESLTWSHTTSAGSDRLLVVSITGDTVPGADNISSVAYNGDALTLVAKRTDGVRYFYLYYLLNPDSGANNVVITLPASGGHFLLAGSATYTGVAQSGQPDASSSTHSGTDADGSLTHSVTTVADNCWVILSAHGYDGSNGAPTAGSGSTRRTFEASFGTWGLFDTNGVVTPAGSKSMTWTYPATGGDMSSIMASFSPAGGGGGGSTPSPAAGALSLAGTTGSLGFTINLPDEA